MDEDCMWELANHPGSLFWIEKDDPDVLVDFCPEFRIDFGGAHCSKAFFVGHLFFGEEGAGNAFGLFFGGNRCVHNERIEEKRSLSTFY